MTSIKFPTEPRNLFIVHCETEDTPDNIKIKSNANKPVLITTLIN
jgi:hypothetical protein